VYSRFYDQDHQAFRQSVRTFVEREVAPHQHAWEDACKIDPQLWRIAAKHGFLGLAVPEEYGGGGVRDFRFRCVVMDELARAGAASVHAAMSLLDDLVAPYLVDLATEEQKARWLPGLCSGETTPAIAITEPGAGSNLRGLATTAVRDGDEWRLNGSKTFITNGGHADMLIVVARSNPSARSDSFTLLVVEKHMPGFSAGEGLDKLGQRAENVSELFFDDVRVPTTNVLGTEGAALAYLRERLSTERLSIAYFALAAAEAALAWTLEFTKQRQAFGKPIAQFQNSRFLLAEIATEIDLTRAFLENAVLAHNDDRLTAVDAAKAKWWATELQQRVVTRCLQLHGGYGYMREYPIARAFVDARIQTIYGGTTEIMKEIIGRDLVR
jgi:alkylation response protein AidB-like acyl-CoA dehydrogenase